MSVTTTHTQLGETNMKLFDFVKWAQRKGCVIKNGSKYLYIDIPVNHNTLFPTSLRFRASKVSIRKQVKTPLGWKNYGQVMY